VDPTSNSNDGKHSADGSRSQHECCSSEAAAVLAHRVARGDVPDLRGDAVTGGELGALACQSRLLSRSRVSSGGFRPSDIALSHAFVPADEALATGQGTQC
jgi:hypothetical protein